jgi:hypothetical protein
MYSKKATLVRLFLLCLYSAGVRKVLCDGTSTYALQQVVRPAPIPQHSHEGPILDWSEATTPPPTPGTSEDESPISLKPSDSGALDEASNSRPSTLLRDQWDALPNDDLELAVVGDSVYARLSEKAKVSQWLLEIGQAKKPLRHGEVIVWTATSISGQQSSETSFETYGHLGSHVRVTAFGSNGNAIASAMAVKQKVDRHVLRVMTTNSDFMRRRLHPIRQSPLIGTRCDDFFWALPWSASGSSWPGW